MKNLICGAFGLVASIVVSVCPGNAEVPAQTVFATPDEAASVLKQALKTQDMEKLLQIFGADAAKELSSGDPALDRHDREVISLAMEQSWRWVPRGAKSKELVIGDEAWPFPIPLTKKGAGWQFDTQAGKEEVQARRIGVNELAIIDLCRAYPGFQQEYASKPHDGKPAGLYAQVIRSTAGQQNGLYWDPKPGEPLSPLGDLVATAAADGYVAGPTTAPFFGYHFRILTAQGKSATGGARNYITDGGMSQGFALIAYPARYGYSGVMTFIVNQDGIVFEKDLGPDTARVAAGITVFDPDRTWAKVR